MFLWLHGSRFTALLLAKEWAQTLADPNTVRLWKDFNKQGYYITLFLFQENLYSHVDGCSSPHRNA